MTLPVSGGSQPNEAPGTDPRVRAGAASGAPEGPSSAEAGVSAVEQFSAVHAALREAAQARYRAWMPAEPPGPGEQYAFEVDLDACTGCKSCVTACHNLNGLDEGETWRTVGLLVGGTGDSFELPFQQSVTTSCHHCEDPGCLNGCPVQAYEKDPKTGIVRHLDDQCIGCQYCVLKCPYDAPKYNATLGIVRKCDLCTDRLAADQAPACVQGCPNGAITVRVVDTKTQGQPDPLLALPSDQMPDAAYTRPTTRYRSKRKGSFDRAGSFGRPRPAHAHTPLAVMLTLSQLAVGGLLVGLFTAGGPWGSDVPAGDGAAAAGSLGVWGTTVVTALGLAGLSASILHLGRPLGAWKAFLGWRTSWMSREILALGGFAKLAVLYVALQWLAPWLRPWVELDSSLIGALGVVTVLAGIAGVFCSVMIYADTQRPFWKFERTATRFGLSTLLLGVVSWVAVAHAFRALAPAGSVSPGGVSGGLLGLAVLLAAVKLAWELALLRQADVAPRTALGRSAELLRGALRAPFALRCTAGVVGGIVLPIVLWALPGGSAAALPCALATWGLVLLGELAERWLFFTAEATASMPEV